MESDPDFEDDLDDVEKSSETYESDSTSKPKLPKTSRRGPGPAKSIRSRSKKVDVQTSLAPRKHVLLKCEEPLEPPRRERVNIESLRERMEMVYGQGDSELVAAIDSRIMWGNSPFIPIKDKFKSSPILPNSNSVAFSETKPNTNTLHHHNLVLEDIELIPDATLKADNSILLNAGNQISCLSWAYGQQYLAVALVHDPSGRSAQMTSPSRADLSLSYDPNSLEANIRGEVLIYSLNTGEPTVTKVASFVFPGHVLKVSWRPLNGSGDLAVVIQNQGTTVIDALGVQGTYELLNPHFLQESGSTCAWRSPDILVIGTKRGSIIEYDLKYRDFVPSYSFVVHHSVIVDLVTAYPEHPDILFTSSVDGLSKVIDLRDPRVDQTTSVRSKMYARNTGWVPVMQSFLGIEDVITSRLVPLRKAGLAMGGVSLTRHKSYVYSLACSLFHPFILSGGVDGGLHIANAVRRLMVPRRHSKTYNDLHLWTLECGDKTSILRMREENEPGPVTKHGQLDRIVLFPPSCTITSIDWSKCFVCAGWYAAGSICGLVRIENLGL